MTGPYRYTYCRTLPDGGPQWLWVLLNPQTRDHIHAGPVLNRIEAATKTGRGGGFYVAHLYAWLTPTPEALFMLPEYQRIGPLNDLALQQFAADARASKGKIVVAWGDHPKARERGASVVKALREVMPVHCLGLSRSRNPMHPLYVAGSASVRPLP